MRRADETSLPGGVPEYVDGILEIHVPKALEAAKPKTTKVSIGTTVEQPKLEGESE